MKADFTSELFSFVKRKCCFFCVCILLAGAFISVLSYSFDYKQMGAFDSYTVPEYDSVEVLNACISTRLDTIENFELQQRPDIYGDDIERLKEEILIFEYIRDNGIPSGSVVTRDDMIGVKNNWFSFVYHIDYVSIFLFIAFEVAALFVVTLDFQNGTYKFIYQKNSRLKVLLAKFVFFVSVCAVITVAAYITIIPYGFIITEGQSRNLILFANEGKVIGYSVFSFIALRFVSLLIWLLWYAAAFFFISVLLVTPIKSLIVTVLFFLCDAVLQCNISRGIYRELHCSVFMA